MSKQPKKVQGHRLKRMLSNFKQRRYASFLKTLAISLHHPRYISSRIAAVKKLKVENVKAVVFNHGSAEPLAFPPVQSRGSARNYTNSHLILLIKLKAVFFCKRQLNYCTRIPRATGMFPWDSSPAKRLKTTALKHH